MDADTYVLVDYINVLMVALVFLGVSCSINFSSVIKYLDCYVAF